MQGRKALLAIFWILGLFLGCYLATELSTEVVFTISTITEQRTSIFVLFLLPAISLLLSYFAARLRLQLLMIPIAMGKAICFSFCASCLIFAFEDAGWLLYRFYLFSDSISVIILIWFWNRHISSNTDSLNKHLIFSLTAIFVISMSDYFLVSPFVRMLWNY